MNKEEKRIATVDVITTKNHTPVDIRLKEEAKTKLIITDTTNPMLCHLYLSLTSLNPKYVKKIAHMQ